MENGYCSQIEYVAEDIEDTNTGIKTDSLTQLIQRRMTQLNCKRRLNIDTSIDLTMLWKVWQQQLIKTNRVSWQVTSFPTRQTWDFFSGKSKDLICASGELHRKFGTLGPLGNVDFKQNSHRARIVQKWKQLTGQLYHKVMECLKEVSSADNYVPIPYDIGHSIETIHVSAFP